MPNKNNKKNLIDTHPVGRIFNIGKEKAVWKRVTELKPGVKIAVEKDGNLAWDEIVEIKSVGLERVWDIEVEGTHNFVGNGIIAHNTFLNDLVGIGTTNPADTTLNLSSTSPSSINMLDVDGVIRINQSVVTDTVSNTLYNNSDVLMWNDKQISAGPNLYSINGSVSNDEYLSLQHKQGTTDILVTAWVNDGTKWVKIANLGDPSDTTGDYYFTTPDSDTVRLHNKSGNSQSLKLDIFVSGANVAEWYTLDNTFADTSTASDVSDISDTSDTSDVITTGTSPSTEITLPGSSPDTSITESTSVPNTEITKIESGDVVALSTNIDDYGMPMIRKTSTYYDSSLFGVVTTSASHEMGIQRDGRKLVALSGRVPVKIDPASSDIKPGDFITASSLEGHATKAEMPGRVIGTALQSWNKNSGDKKVLVLVNPTYNSPTAQALTSALSSDSSTSGDISNEMLTLRDQIVALSNNLKDTLSSLGMTLTKDEVSEKDTLAINSDMHILGDVTLTNLTVTGDIQAGMVTIDTLSNSVDVLGSSCYNSETNTINDTLCNDQALHLQKSGSGMIDMFDGKIVAKPNGTLVIENSIETKKLVINTSDVESAAAGKTTIKAGDTSITIDTSAVNDKSIIMITPERPATVGSKYKQEGKFEIVLKEAQAEDLDISWIIVDRKD
ncbi:MAG: hypothetical protein ABIJ82_01230 [Patescibacteria group bacterium]|nr:hypothetical protein [Patescibacteria group bacterium]MBU1953317.1 hypothetical protein [Patescibacteria group bacterium]